ncbi:MAG: aromatic aminobenezylarsenical efflux permease ArsG family transporter, partial [Candidatus Shapirobacteria bacterium]
NMEWINYLIDTYNIPLLSAFLIGIMTSISPCPLATNITAIAFISKDIKSSKQTLLNGLFYTLGRGISYTLLATLIYFGLSSFSVSSIFQGWGDKALGPVLILIGLIMADIIKINLKTSSPKVEQIKLWLAKKGYIGSLFLGMLFALAFCPYSGVLFFGVLIPMVLKSSESLLLPPLFALGTGLPVTIFSFVLAFSAKKIGIVFNKIQKVEVIVRKTIAFVFIIVGLYYCQFLVKLLF